MIDREMSAAPSVPLHEWNTEFTWEPVGGPLRLLDEASRRQYNEDGYCVLPDVVPPDLVARLVTEVDALEAASAAKLREMPDGRAFIAQGEQFTFTVQMVRHSALLRAFYGSQLFRDIASDLVGPNVRLFWDHAVYKKPHMPLRFPWHQDNGFTFVRPQQYLTCWIALSDAYESNGGIQVVPGVHKLGTLRHRRTELGNVCFDETPPNAVALSVRAGSIICFSSTTPHQTGPNLTDKVRRALVSQYLPDGATGTIREADGSIVTTPINDPVTQFWILRDGQPV